MRLLLDTHVLVWSQEAVSNLGPKTQRLLSSPRHELLISAVSTLEIARLVHLGRLTFKVPIEAWFSQAITTLQATSVTIDDALAREAYALPGRLHKDPADRLLVATARLHQAALLTADDSLLGYKHVRTRDARQ
jgi:PIN domain nuclease of toxin-antitoxin system